VGRWADEARILLAAEGSSEGTVAVRLGAGRWLLLEVDAGGIRAAAPAAGHPHGLPVLPDAATWVLPDLELLRAGLLTPGELHPLVAEALVPGYRPTRPRPGPKPPGGARFVECHGARHRIGLVDDVLVPLDHTPEEIGREELLAELTGTPMPCLQAIDAVHRRPEALDDVRARLDHGDVAGALAVVESLLGRGAVLRNGSLREALAGAARGRVAYGLFRAGLSVPGAPRTPPGTAGSVRALPHSRGGSPGSLRAAPPPRPRSGHVRGRTLRA
jgi:hypothetical protein